MSDHVDGPRSIGEPAANLTDLFGFASSERSARPDLDRECPSATDGEIAAINLEGVRRRAWARFAQGAHHPGMAEAVVDAERLAAQFFGDLDALAVWRRSLRSLHAWTTHLARSSIHAEVASTVHRFDDARSHLARARRMGAPLEDIERHSLAIDQACGAELEGVLFARRNIAAASGRLEDLVPLGAVLADLERFTEADAVYGQAFYSYDGISPFPPAWVCFLLGMLWGELVPVPDLDLAELWYRRAIAYLPGYVKARVHLAEICATRGQIRDAEALLMPALSSNDPEVRWRLADVLLAQEKFEEAREQLNAARCGFNELLRRHPLAFSDHAAEFYAGSGNDRPRALELARANVENRPTPRAIAQMNAIACRHAGVRS